MIHPEGWRCLIVGGGAVAVRRARALVDAGAFVTVIAPEMDDRLATMEIDRVLSRFDPATHPLDVYRLVVIATDDPATNATAATAIAKLPHPPLCNRADEADAGEVSFMAAHRDGPVTLAVHTGGASASAAATIRDAMANGLDPCWAGVLEEAIEARRAIQREVTDPAKRSAMLRRLTDGDALACFRAGGPDALRSRYRDIMRGSA